MSEVIETHQVEETENHLFTTLKTLKAVDHERLIRGMMYIAGVRQIDIARKYGIDKTVLSKVLSGKRKSRRVREAIAQELNVPFKSLWPEGVFKTAAASLPTEEIEEF